LNLEQMKISPATPLFFLTYESQLVKGFLIVFGVILSVASIASWRLVYAFVEKEECSKEEKTFGQSWEIKQISHFAFMLVFLFYLLPPANEVNVYRKRKITTAGLEKDTHDAAGWT
jgi:hypothetical protein